MRPHWDHEMALNRDAWERTRDLLKQVEMRLDLEKWATIQVGHVIVFRREPEREAGLYVRVEEIVRRPFFAELLVHFPGPTYFSRSNEEVLTRLRVHYTESEEREHGIVGWRVVPLVSYDPAQ